MLPKNLHIEEINRFHEIFKEVNDEVKKLEVLKLEPNYVQSEEEKRKEYLLLKQYMKLSQIWSEIDDFIEFTLKFKLDLILNDDE